MKTITNKEKAKEIANIYRDRMLQMSQICDNDWLIVELVNDVLEWKDEQFAQERQALIQKYEDKLKNKLNQREEVIRDNVRRANSRYGFEGLF